jgi:hypothetical protein
VSTASHRKPFLGDALSAALREGREDKLDEYAAGSRAEAMQVVGLAHGLTRLATAPPAVRPLRNVALRLLAQAAQQATPAKESRSGWLPDTASVIATCCGQQVNEAL